MEKLIDFNGHQYLVDDIKPERGDWMIGYAVGLNGRGAGHFIHFHDGSNRAKLSAISEGTFKIKATNNSSLGLPNLK